MTRLHLAAMGLCALLGCGGEDGGGDTPAERLSGHWALEDSATECLLVFSFDGDGYVELKEICELTDGSTAIVLDTGTYDATDDAFTWRVAESSCADADDEPETIRYTLDGDTLTLITPDGVLVMERIQPGGGGGIAAFGCFDDEGYFEPGPVEPI